ncbi:hypothetical protein F383_01851 [Gossypium arboreum]|uniref:Uncharacterized protein n=1 Tax=Gossypium arboreum TaxID=29729 RepID=A0A0B0PNY0_GOSAR|nr:hypothetical protein F383_01851 [Gossypium arboreum]
MVVMLMFLCLTVVIYVCLDNS